MFSNKVSGFLIITVLVAVSLFALSFFIGSDNAIAGEATWLPAGGLEDRNRDEPVPHEEDEARYAEEENREESFDPASCDRELEIPVEGVGCVLRTSIVYSDYNGEDELCHLYQGVYDSSSEICYKYEDDADFDGYLNGYELNYGTDPEDAFSPIECGDELNINNREYKLTGDLICDNSEAIKISANSVTLDCQDFTIESSDIAEQRWGIVISGEDVAIQNCVIDSFWYGIEADNSGVMIRDNTFQNNVQTDLRLSSAAEDAEVRENIFSGGAYVGIYQFAGSTSTIYDNVIDSVTAILLHSNVADSTVEANDITFSTYGIRMISTQSIDILENSFSDGTAAGRAINIEGVVSDINLEDNSMCDVWGSVYCPSSSTGITAVDNYLAGVNSCSSLVTSSNNFECS